jgi:hypothetical protein
MNCFGLLAREAGHSRAPAPPQSTTGITSPLGHTVVDGCSKGEANVMMLVG